MKKALFYGGLIFSFLCIICSPLAAETDDELFLEGLYGEAIDAYKVELKSFEMTDEFAQYYNNVASAYYQIEDVKQAIHYIQLAADVVPDDDMPWLNLARLYELIGEFDAAEESYLKATASTKPFIAAYGYLGAAQFLLERDEPYDALATLKEALVRIERETDPEAQEIRTFIYSNIGYIYGSIGEIEAAFDAFGAAIDTGTESSLPWLYLGAFLENAGMYEEAFLMYLEALARDSDTMPLAQEAYDSLYTKHEAANS